MRPTSPLGVPQVISSAFWGGIGSNFTDLPENICHVGADICKQRSDTDRYPAGLRELAARARRLAQELTDEAEAKQFIGIADEMEGKAAALEAHTQAER